jgi:PAS domain S-box-containing protein
VPGFYEYIFSPAFAEDGTVELVAGCTRDITERKHAEAALRESERRQREIASELEVERARLLDAQAAGKFGSWEVDLSTSNVRWSEETFRIFETNKDQFQGTHAEFLAMVHPEDRAAVEAALASSLGQQGSHSFEHRLLLADGRITFVEERWQLIYDVQGQPLRAVGTCHDISERKRSEQVIARTLQRMNDAQRLGQIGDWDWEIASQTITWSPQVFEIVGRDPSLGQPRDYEEVAASYDAPSQALMQEKVRHAMESGETQEYELVALRADGRRVQVQAKAVPRKDENARVVGLFGTIQDITERKQADETRARLAAIVESSSDPIIGKTLEGIITSWNAGAERLFGYRAEEIIGQSITTIIPPERQGEETRFMERVRQEERIEHFETVRLAKDGRRIEMSLSISPVRDAGGRVIGASKIARDITERKRAELKISDAKREIEQLNADLEKRVAQRTEALAAATAEAERANHAKSEFLSRMSHELRTPMNAILGFAQVLETEDGLTGDQRDSVDQILRGGGHLLELINEVLDITSIESGRLTLSSEPVALAGLLTETLSLLRPLSADLQIEVAVLASERAGSHVQADRQRLKQVLLNLLGNALKYNRPGGSVTVRYAAAAGSTPRTRLSVTDTGAGLSAAKLARLFHPFDRLGAEQTRVEGTGLGLLLARRMVEQMGGTLGVESVVGEGSTFWIELPTAEAPVMPEVTAADLVQTSDPVVPADARVILYIEDNPSNVRLVTRILARRPAVRLLCAETGALGLKMAREHRPDLILLDLHLPDCLGDDVLTSLAADPRTGAIPVVMLTADAVVGTRDAMLASGARAFITKPLDVRNFLGVVDRYAA